MSWPSITRLDIRNLWNLGHLNHTTISPSTNPWKPQGKLPPQFFQTFHVPRLLPFCPVWHLQVPIEISIESKGWVITPRPRLYLWQLPWLYLKGVLVQPKNMGIFKDKYHMMNSCEWSRTCWTWMFVKALFLSRNLPFWHCSSNMFMFKESELGCSINLTECPPIVINSYSSLGILIFANLYF